MGRLPATGVWIVWCEASWVDDPARRLQPAFIPVKRDLRCNRGVRWR
jgi:hypothetical protein